MKLNKHERMLIKKQKQLTRNRMSEVKAPRMSRAVGKSMYFMQDDIKLGSRRKSHA